MYFEKEKYIGHNELINGKTNNEKKRKGKKIKNKKGIYLCLLLLTLPAYHYG
jgi:hypothetical protein